jgi:putative redox protein
VRHEVTCDWKGDMAFEADVLGHKLLIDAGPEAGGHDSGTRPKPLILAALAGCSGMDVVSILKKMREPLSSFSMRVEGDAAEEDPKYYEKIKIVYEFKEADGLDRAKVEKAVSLSQEKYCGVAGLLKRAIPLAWEIVYRG